MKTATSKKKPAAAAKANNLQLPGIPALQFVPLELIETTLQIRTEFDQESIEELAGDIKARGMLQPVLLRPLAGGKFLMIAGERRLRAARFAELDNIPALIGEVDDQNAALMQLAENIHREELSLEDECSAICKLYESLGSLAKVANAVKKSVPWCSKRFAMKQTGFCWWARHLLEDGITEDLELLRAVNALNQFIYHSDMQEWVKKITEGNAGRKEIREALKLAKEKAAAEEKEHQTNQAISHAKPKTPPAPPVWEIEEAMEELSQALTYADADLNGTELLNTWTTEQVQQITDRLAAAKNIGQSDEGFKTIQKLIMHGLYQTPFYDIEMAAMAWGLTGKEFDIAKFLEELQTPSKIEKE